MRRDQLVPPHAPLHIVSRVKQSISVLSHAVDEELDALRNECSGLREELLTAVEAVRNTSVSVNTKFEETQKRDTERIDSAVQHVTEQNAKLEVRPRDRIRHMRRRRALVGPWSRRVRRFTR